MAERPDLDYVVPILRKELRGRSITGFELRKPVVLRVAVPGEPAALLEGLSFKTVTRRAHFAIFELRGERDLDMPVAPMLAGRFRIDPIGAKGPADIAAAWRLDDGRELRYRDQVQMGKVYLTEPGDRSVVPGLQKVGIDVLSQKAFTREAFEQIASKRKDQVRVFLMDKSALDAFGNAYADEVLWRAGIHPKAWVRKLDAEAKDRLYAAIGEVLREATAEIKRRKPPLDEKLRDFVKVRRRHGEPCARCGTKIRKAGVRGFDSFFCPTCQPDDRGSGLVDWRKAKKG